MADERHSKAIFKSEFSMGQYDFERFNKLLYNMDEYAVRVACSDFTALIPLFSVLWEIYKNFQPIIFETEREYYKKQFKSVRINIDSELNRIAYNKRNSMYSDLSISRSLLFKLDKLQMDMLQIKQIIGLGISVQKQEVFKTKIERALGVSHD